MAIYIYMSAHACMNICFWGFSLVCFINSIYGLVLFHNLALGYMLENVILFYMYIHFYLMNFISCLVMGYPLFTAIVHEIVDGYTCFIVVLAFIALCQKWRNKDVQSINLKISTLYKDRIIQLFMSNRFFVEFQRFPLKFDTSFIIRTPYIERYIVCWELNI